MNNPFKRVNDRPMRYKILDLLRTGQDISGVEAAAMYRCRDLPKRISELRAEGHDIRSEQKQDATGQRYNRYVLAAAAAQAAV